MRPVRENINPSSLIMMGIPKHFCNKTILDFNDYNNSDLKRLKRFVLDYIRELPQKIEDNSGIFFYGSNGVGKSMLACIILKEAYRRRYTCRRVTFSNYISYYTEAWNTRDKDEKDVIEQDFYEKYKGVELLVLEEIGKEIDSKIAKPILEDLLRYREEHSLLTIICSNITPAVIEETYGPSVMSIIKGTMTSAKITGSDKRQEVFDEKSRN